MALSPTLENIDRLNAQALVVFLPDDPLPLSGFLSLLDWRLCFRLSQWILEHRYRLPKEPVLMADFKNLTFGRIFVLACGDSTTSPKSLDAKILQMLKIVSKAQISKFAVAFPDRYDWIFDHWKNHYESHAVFQNILVFEQFRH